MEAKFDGLEKNMEQKLDDLRKSIEAKVERRPFEKIGSKFYYIEQSENLNWFQAVHKCRILGGQLVSIKNLVEFNAIVSKLVSGKNYWIDITDLGSEGEFRSMQTGLKATYFNWHKNNPDNWKNAEHCGEIWFHDNKHLMNDGDCKSRKLFICQPDNC
ncbi:hypothetical protein KR093_001890 [Drosophila rubida]|uniref:C-type lectin domain-containing protein n=1 Tax=Drosophila rubida TaxID=30044 RepID=A0AAD4K3P9_9MUSC|nr:hypothetical protein KR093_001890 [Drosophila rubida]